MKEKEILEVLEVLKEVGAVIPNSHIIYTPKWHSDYYIYKYAILAYPNKVVQLCREIAGRFTGDNVDVCSSIGGGILSHVTANQLTRLTGREVLNVSIPSEKIGSFCNDLVSGKNVLVVESIFTPSGLVETLKLLKAIRSLSGNIVGLGVMFNYCDFNYCGCTPEDVAYLPKFVALVNLRFNLWTKKDCPLCKKGIPFRF